MNEGDENDVGDIERNDLITSPTIQSDLKRCDDVTDGLPELAIQTAEAAATLYQLTRSTTSSAEEQKRKVKKLICLCLTLLFLVISFALTCYNIIFSAATRSDGVLTCTSYLLNDTIYQ